MKLTFDVPEEMAEKIVEDIKVALEEYKKKQIWPRHDDTYYYVSACGETSGTLFINTAFDKGCLSYGNCFKTQEEAKFKAEQLKVLHELEELADDDQPWGNLKYYGIFYVHDFNDIVAECWISYQHLPSTYYFKSYESAKAAIDKIGKDRLKKYYFCIPEKKDQQLQEAENYANT